MTLSRALRPHSRTYSGRHRRPAPAGPSSMRARSAMAATGLGVTGVALAAGAGGASAATGHRTPVLAYDSRGSAVMDLQARLGVSPVSGWFGPKTRAAVRALQAREGLPRTGVVDKLTWRALPAAKKITRPVSPSRVSRSGARVEDSVESLNWAALGRCEAGGNPRAYNPAGYYGLYQFSLGTWRGVGGSGNPAEASADEQTYRAQLLYARRGDSPWPHCGRLLFS